MDIVTGIPDLVERVIQCARLIEDASNICKNLEDKSKHGQSVAHQLIIMGDVIKEKKYFTTTGIQITDALQRAEEAAIDFLRKLEEARSKHGMISRSATPPRLGGTDRTPSPPSIGSQVTLPEKAEHPNDGNTPSALLVIRQDLCGLPMPPFSRRIKSFWRRAKKLDLCRKVSAFGSRFVGAFYRAHFLALIERDIASALLRMDEARADIFILLYIAPIHSQAIGDEHAQEFIRNAQERLKDERPIERIDISREWLSPIDERLKADESGAKHTYTLYTITDGPYAGCLVDRRDISHLRTSTKSSAETAMSDTDNIARLLRRETTSKDGHTDERIAVLRCRGVSFPIPYFHDLVFQLPSGYGAPETLRRVLLDPNRINHVRDARIELAIQICTAVHVLHRLDIVHKGVRPDNIILLPPLPDSADNSKRKAYSATLGKPYLAGFCYSRSDYSQSGMNRPFEAIFADVIYHHPRHLTKWRGEQFEKTDDVYSLGISLLEIGLWRSLLRWSEEEGWYIVGEEWELQGPQYMKGEYDDPHAWYTRRNLFIRLANERLPITMGSSYAEVVVTCLEFREKATSSRGFVADILTKLLSLTY